MERQPVTVYLPAADHRRLCSGDVDRLLVGWDSPSLEAIVAVASFPSWQKPALVAALHDLERMPELRHVFCRHGSLALLDNFPPEGGPSGLRLQGSSGCLPHTRVIKYAVDDFNVVTFAELLALGTNCQQQCASSGCASSSHTSLSSYLIVGRALAGRLNDLLRAKSTDSPLADSSAPLSLLQASRRRCRAFIEAAATTLRLWMIRIVVCASLTAQRLLSVAALFRSPLLQKWMQQTTFISVLSNRLSQAALWQERYAQLQLQTDVVDYLAAKHSIRQSIWSYAVDVGVGAVQFFCFRSGVVYSVNWLRLVLRTLYHSSLKHASYHVATRIGKYCKLSNEIAVFMSRLLLSMLLAWRLIMPKIHDHFVVLSRLFQYSALLGVTCQLAVLIDIVAIETLHIAYAHCIVLYITKWTQRYLFSLLQLFKGKKWNQLKQGLDTNNYTREQLFLGTVIFTLLLLIYPTIWVLYCVVLVVYLPVFVMRALARAVVSVMTKIPSYYLAYNVLFPRRYKEGIHFNYDESWAPGNTLPGGAGSDTATPASSGIRVVAPCRPLEIECAKFSFRTVYQPMVNALKSCCEHLNIWGVI